VLDRYFYTYHNPAGNHFLRGRGRFPKVRVVDIALRGRPVWAVGYAMESAIWHVVLADGALQVIEVTLDGQARALAYEAGWFAGAPPPVVGVSMLEGTYVLRSDASVAPYSHPIPVNDFEVLYIDRAGDLLLGREEGVAARLPIQAALDARPVMNRLGQVAVYANARDQRYAHGVLGDAQESATLLVLAAGAGELRVLARVDLPAADVYEGIAPFWADIDGDGAEDLLSTVSNASGGARLRAYLWRDGRIAQTADSPPLGQGRRWRHQLAAAPFGPQGEIEIAALRTPHIAGQLEFFRFSGAALQLTAALPGLSTHSLGSRNLDQTAAGDFNGDGRPEVLVMDAARRAVVAVQRSPAGAEIAWSLEAGDEILSNFAPVELLNGELGLAVGTADNRLRVWLPNSEE